MLDLKMANTEEIDHIPLYLEGDTAMESQLRLENDRAGFAVRAYRKAGPLFRTQIDGEIRVVMAGLQANDFVWRNTELWNFPAVFPAFGEQMGPDHLNVLEGQAHRGKRTVLKPAFDQGPAMRFLPEYNHGFHHELEEVRGQGPVELTTFWAETIAKINTQTVARVDLTDDALKRLVKWEKEFLAGIFLGEKRFVYYNRPEYLQLRAEALELIGQMVDAHLAEPARYDDHFSLVLRARAAQPEGLPDRQCLIDDLYYILVAGVENTARLINTVVAQCWMNSAWLGRLRRDLDAWDGKDVMALGKMTSLKAVVMETQRLRPIAFFLPRCANQAFEFGGHRVPSGITLLHAAAAGHFLDEVYPDAMTFQPERFVDNGGFVPKANGFFGGGVHLCLGRNYTLLQTPVALAQTLKYYDLNYRDEAELRSALAVPGRALPSELWAEIKPRTG